MTSVVTLFSADDIATICINREAQLNALNSEVLSELSATIDRLTKTTRAVIMRGSGDKAFVAGADIKEMLESRPEELQRYIEQGQQVMSRLAALPMPVIAVVDGYAMGGGFELALACDLIVCTERARFAFPEVGLGLLPGFGGTQRLSIRVGVGLAKRLIFTGETITGDEAYRLGIANYVFSSQQVWDEVAKLCQTIRHKGPLALAAAKAAIHGLYEANEQAGLKKEVEEFVRVMQTTDAKEGLRAFLEKRKANFSGVE